MTDLIQVGGVLPPPPKSIRCRTCGQRKETEYRPAWNAVLCQPCSDTRARMLQRPDIDIAELPTIYPPGQAPFELASGFPVSRETDSYLPGAEVPSCSCGSGLPFGQCQDRGSAKVAFGVSFRERLLPGDFRRVTALFDYFELGQALKFKRPFGVGTRRDRPSYPHGYSMQGWPTDRLGDELRNKPFGKLPKRLIADMDRSEFVIWSFETPIAWLGYDTGLSGVWVIPRVSYSSRTAEHVSFLDYSISRSMLRSERIS